jgi:pyruvate dehydrogenase E1 component
MVSRWLPEGYSSLGTDGFGRSDTREALRAFFQIDPPAIAAAAMAELARCGQVTASRATKAIRELDIDPEAADPLEV